MIRVIQRGLGLAFGLGLAIALTACQAQQLVTPSPTTQTSRTEYGTQEEAVAQMRDVYGRYTTALTRIYQSGGHGADEVAQFTTSAKLARDAKEFQAFAASGNHLTGVAKISAFRAQAVDLETGSGRVYVCVDVAGTAVKDASGKDVTPKSRPIKQALVVGFVSGPLIDSSESWTGSGVC